MWTHLHRFARATAAAVAVLGAVALTAAAQPDEKRVAKSAPAAAVSATPDADGERNSRNARLHATARELFPGDEAVPAAKRLARLTRDQIDASVGSLLPGHVVRSVKTAMPRDPLQTNYEYAEMLALNAANLGGLSQWIGEIAAHVRKDAAGVIACPATAAASDKACLAAEARKLIIKAFRGDVTEAKVEKLVKFFLTAVEGAGVAQATGDLVEVLLNSPDFLFRRELDVDAAGRLVPAQHLAALSYTLTDAPPDALGLRAVDAARHLGSPTETARTAATILASPATRAKLKRFFLAWLEVREPAEFTISRETFPEFGTELAQAMLTETQRFLDEALAKPKPRLADITQAVTTPLPSGLAAIYGASAKASAAGAGKTVAEASLDTTRRLGIFTQPAVLASHSGPVDTRPVKRGVFWSRKVMCMASGSAAKTLNVALPERRRTTERKRIEAATRAPACIGCHKTIDPMGFFLENYDALGRWRDFDNGFPVDARVQLDVTEEEPVVTDGPVEALKHLTASATFKQCFVRQLFRFYMGRTEEPGDDPLLRRMFFDFADNDEQDILKAVRTLATSDAIALRQ